MEQVNGKVGKTVQSFEEFNASRKARSEAELAELAERAEGGPKPAPRKRKAKTADGVKEASLADLLLQAVRLVSTRKGRIPQTMAVRERTLLDVLVEAMGE